MASPLTDLGREQARDVRVLLDQTDLPTDCRAWVSPLGRTMATAKLALDGHFEEWTTDDRLKEINVGQA